MWVRHWQVLKIRENSVLQLRIEPESLAFLASAILLDHKDTCCILFLPGDIIEDIVKY